MAAKTEGGFTNRVDALKQTVEEVCVELASLGEESLFMSINLKQRSCFYLGSEPGKEFLTKRMDIIENFYHFINTNYPLDDSEHQSTSSSPTKAAQYTGDLDYEKIPQSVQPQESDADDSNSFTIDNEMREDPDFEHNLKKNSLASLFKKRAVGRPRKTDIFDGRDRNATLLEDMEKVIMNKPITPDIPFGDQLSNLNESGSKIEKIVTSDVEFVKSLRNNRKCLLICGNCGTPCSWKRSMLTHLGICKGKKKEIKEDDTDTQTTLVMQDKTSETKETETMTSEGGQIVMELLDGNGELQIAVLQASTEDTLAQNLQLQRDASKPSEDPLVQAIQSITEGQAGTQSSAEKDQKSADELNQSSEKETQQTGLPEMMETLQTEKVPPENSHATKEQTSSQDDGDSQDSKVSQASEYQDDTMDSTMDDEDMEKNLEDIEAMESLIMTSGAGDNKRKDINEENDEEMDNEDLEEPVEDDNDPDFNAQEEAKGIEQSTPRTRSRRQIKMSKKYEEYIVKVKKEPVEEYQTAEEVPKMNETSTPMMTRKRKAEESPILTKSTRGKKQKNQSEIEKTPVPASKRVRTTEEEPEEVVTPKRGRGRPPRNPKTPTVQKEGKTDKKQDEKTEEKSQNEEKAVEQDGEDSQEDNGEEEGENEETFRDEISEKDVEGDEDNSKDFKAIVEPVKKVKGKRGRKRGGKKENETGYKITAQDVNEAADISEEKGDFKCKQCNIVIKWKRSFMRHIEQHRLLNEGKTDYHRCPQCDREFVSEWEMKNHMRGKHKMLGVFDCDTCPRKFNTAVQYKNHKKECSEENPMAQESEDAEEKPYTCNYCLFKFKSEDQLITHKELHNIMEFKCDECGKVFPEGYRLKNHKRDAHDKSKHFSCDICGKVFTSTRYLHRHRVCVHKQTESVCRVCAKLFPTKEELRLHIKTAHEETDSLTCGVCRKKFASLRDLDAHRPEHYGYQCDTCGKKFQKLIKLREHVHSHTGNYPYYCDFCKKGFLHTHALETHLQSHESNRPIYICDICGQQFKTKTILLKHANVHKETVDYPCKFCDTAYRTPDGLKIHMIEVHMTEDQIKSCGLDIFKCEICDKVMARKQHYDRHKAQHLGLKKYKCDDCNMSFYTQYHLNRHHKLHHDQTKFANQRSMLHAGEDGKEHAEEIITETIVEENVDNAETIQYIGSIEDPNTQVQTISYTMTGEGEDSQMVEFVVINVPQDSVAEVVEQQEGAEGGEVVAHVTEDGTVVTRVTEMPPETDPQNAQEVTTTITAEDENDVVQSILNLQEAINMS